MSDKIFMDTNIWIYLYSDDAKSEIAEQLINQYFEHIVISTQVLGECFSILTEKRIKTSEEAKEIVNDMAMAYMTIGIDRFSVLNALELRHLIHRRYAA
jgi:predicted nucleic acid-binding protein